MGFTAFTRRYAPEEKRGFIREMYVHFQRMINPDKYFTKYVGDGILVGKEIDDSVSYPVLKEFLKAVYVLGFNVQQTINESDTGLGGVVIRYTMGMSFKLMVKNPYGGAPEKVAEYVDYPINLATRLTEVHRNHLAVCTGNIASVIKRNKNGVILTPLLEPDEKPRGIDIDDLKDLSALAFDENENRGYVHDR